LGTRDELLRFHGLDGNGIAGRILENEVKKEERKEKKVGSKDGISIF
jgi:hypothetical protein